MAKSKSRKKFYKILSFILIICSVVTTGLIIYFDIIPTKYLYIALGLFWAVNIFLVYKLNTRCIKLKKLLCSFMAMVFILIDILGIIYAVGGIDLIQNIFDNGYHTQTFGVYVLSDKYQKIEDLKDKKIVIYDYQDEFLDEALKQLNEKITFKKEKEDYIDEAVSSVVNKRSEAIFINDEMYEAYLENNENELTRIGEISVTLKKENTFKSVNVTRNAFVVYISGTDTTGKVRSSSRSDVNILAFINPKTNNVLLLSTPRDYFVKIPSKNGKNKLAHIGIYGVEESAKALEELYGIEVNYYVRVNFSSFIKIIDAVGGITVNVQKPDFRYNMSIDCGGYVCEQNSNREFGSKLIKIKAGKQTLSGEEALAYARNRHQYRLGDNDRQVHQADVLKATLEKLTSTKVLTKYNSIINSLSNGIMTNMDKSTITKLVNNQLDKNPKWNIESIKVTGKDAYEQTYTSGKLKSYVMLPDEESVNAAKEKIKLVMEG